ncbi:Protein of unknown function [Gryllus bimaculatus]|nr:Protein of unknown function [Gryllus bimaculatus]
MSKRKMRGRQQHSVVAMTMLTLLILAVGVHETSSSTIACPVCFFKCPPVECADGQEPAEVTLTLHEKECDILQMTRDNVEEIARHGKYNMHVLVMTPYPKSRNP